MRLRQPLTAMPFASDKPSPIRVIVADDSPFVCRLLTHYLQSSPDFQVVGQALNGNQAVALVRETRPDAITLDLTMPGMSGLEVLEQIMHDAPIPVLIVSGVSREAAEVTLQALNMGAVDFILKYTPGVNTNPELLRREIIAKVRAASQIKVVRSLRTGRFGTGNGQQVSGPSPVQEKIAPSLPPPDEAKPKLPRKMAALYLPGGVVVIGASTGGPVTVRELLSALPPNFGAAILVVQHIAASFTPVLAAQLNRQIALKVSEARPGDRLQPGHVFVAPGDFHMLLRPDARIELTKGPEIKGHRPSIDATMQSAAQVYGTRAMGVVLTGMGNDGTLGLAAIRSKGGKTFAQDAASCVINGMPQQAIDKGVVDQVAPPLEIAHLLQAILKTA